MVLGIEVIWYEIKLKKDDSIRGKSQGKGTWSQNSQSFKNKIGKEGKTSNADKKYKGDRQDKRGNKKGTSINKNGNGSSMCWISELIGCQLCIW